MNPFPGYDGIYDTGRAHRFQHDREVRRRRWGSLSHRPRIRSRLAAFGRR